MFEVLLRKLKILRFSRPFLWSKFKSFSGDGVRQRMSVFDILSAMLRAKEVTNDAALGGNSVATDFWAFIFRNAVEYFGKVVFGVLSYLCGVSLVVFG